MEEAHQDTVAQVPLTTIKSQYGRISAIAQGKGFNPLALFPTLHALRLHPASAPRSLGLHQACSHPIAAGRLVCGHDR